MSIIIEHQKMPWYVMLFIAIIGKPWHIEIPIRTLIILGVDQIWFEQPFVLGRFLISYTFLSLWTLLRLIYRRMRANSLEKKLRKNTWILLLVIGAINLPAQSTVDSSMTRVEFIESIKDVNPKIVPPGKKKPKHESPEAKWQREAKERKQWMERVRNLNW